MIVSRFFQRVILKQRYSYSSSCVKSVLTFQRSLGITSLSKHDIATPPSHIPLLYRSLSTDSSLVYSGPLAKSVKAIKLFSITTAVCAVSFCPIFIYFGNPATPIIARIALSALVTTVGLSTTFILHWFIKSYVTKLYYNRSTQIATIETLSIFGRKLSSQFHVSKAAPPNDVSAFSTFQANGKHFFLHTEIFEDPELLKQLLGSYSMFEDTSK